MKRLLFLGFGLIPAVLFGQKKEDILSIQRDVATLQDQVKQLQRSQDEKMAALQSMLQQAVDASNRVATGLTGLQRDVDTKLNDQQSKMVAPIATLGAKVDTMSDDLRSVSTNVADLLRRMTALDTKLSDISSAVRTITAPPVVPPPGPPTGASGAAGGPPGMSSEDAWQHAYRDYSSGKGELALSEFESYAQNFPDSADAPAAKYYIGYIYYNAGQYDDAVKAFTAVADFPENPKTPEALYYKGVSLQKSEHRAAAADAFRDFLKRYPHSEHADQARKNLAALSARPTAKKR